MDSFKRRIASALGDALGLYIIPRAEVHILAERHFLKQFFTAFRVDCVFDVGANDGNYVQRIRRAGFSGPVISFEPVPSLAAVLREKAKQDPLWFIEEVALHETEKPVEFKITAFSAVSSVHEPDRELAETHPHSHRIVETISLTTGTLATYFDKYRAQLGFARPFLKTDAQGADLSVAKGAEARLREFVGLQSELAFVPIYNGQDNAFSDAIRFYENSGFELAALLPMMSPLFPRLAEVDCVMFNPRFYTL